MAGEEGEGSCHLPKILLGVMCSPNSPGTRFKSVQGRSALNKSVKTRRQHRSGELGLCHVF